MLLPAGACGRRSEPHASPRRGATAGSGRWLPARPDKKGWREGRGHESKRRPLARRRQLAGSAAPDYSTRQCLLEINNPPPPSMPDGEENQPQGWGWCCHCFSLLLGTIPLLDPQHCCDRCSCHPPVSGAPRHMLELLPLLFILNKETASDTAHIPAPPRRAGMDAQTTQPWVQAGPQDAAPTPGTVGGE